MRGTVSDARTGVGNEGWGSLLRFHRFQIKGRRLMRSIRRTLNDPEAAYTIRQVRDRIFFHPPGDAPGGKAVGFAGPVGDEGATTLSILLGLSLGELRRNRVVFIDGRLERWAFSLYSRTFGLARNSLTYNGACGYFQCWSTRNGNLCFLAPGGRTRSLELFSTEELGRLIGELREAFDFIVFDMPPVIRSSETRMLLPHLDLFFLICASRSTRLADLERARSIVGEVGGSITGVILNKQKVPFWAPVLGKDSFL